MYCTFILLKDLDSCISNKILYIAVHIKRDAWYNRTNVSVYQNMPYIYRSCLGTSRVMSPMSCVGWLCMSIFTSIQGTVTRVYTCGHNTVYDVVRPQGKLFQHIVFTYLFASPARNRLTTRVFYLSTTVLLTDKDVLGFIIRVLIQYCVAGDDYGINLRIISVNTMSSSRYMH